MENGRAYHKRGTSDLPIGFYKPKVTDSDFHYTYWHPELEIGMVVSGTITMLMHNTTQSFSQGDIFIVPSNQLHGLRNAAKGTVQHLLIVDQKAFSMEREHFFQKEFVEPLIEGRLVMPGVLHPDHPAYEKVVKQMQRLARAQIYAPGYKLERYSAVLQLCTALQPYCRIRETMVRKLPTNEVAKQCIVYIREHYSSKLTLGDIAAGCSLQPNYLCSVFKKYTGQTVMEYLNRTRVDIGAELLQNRSVSISEAMAAVGFSSEETFRENFRKFKGVTPRQFRKNGVVSD